LYHDLLADGLSDSEARQNADLPSIPFVASRFAQTKLREFAAEARAALRGAEE
jgi:hypothetical protein